MAGGSSQKNRKSAVLVIQQRLAWLAGGIGFRLSRRRLGYTDVLRVKGFCGGGDPEANNPWSRPHSGINNVKPKFGTGAFDEMLRWSLKDMEAMMGERDGLPLESLDALNKVFVDQKDDNLSNFFLRLGVSCTPFEKNIHPDEGCGERLREDIEKGTQREEGHPLVSEQQAGDSSNPLRKQKSPTDTETGPGNKPGSDNFPYGVSGGAVGGPRGLKGMSSSSMASAAAEELSHTGCLSAGDLLWMELRMEEAQLILQQGSGASKPQALPNYIASDKDAKQNDRSSQRLAQPDDSERKTTMSGAGPSIPPPAVHDDDNHTCRAVAPADGCTGSPSSRVTLQEKSKSQVDTASAAMKEDVTHQVRTDAEVDRPLGKSRSLESTRAQEVDAHQSGISDCQRNNSKDSESISRVDESGSKHSMCCSEQTQFPMAALGELHSDKPPSNRETAKRHQTTVISTENDAVDCTKCEKDGVEKAAHQSVRPCEPTNLSPFSGVQTGQHPVNSLNAIQCLPVEGTPDHKYNFAKITEEGGREEVEGEEDDAVAETGSQRMDRVNHHRVVVGESSKSEQVDGGVDNTDRNSNMTEEGRKEKAGGEHDAVLPGDDDAVLRGEDDAVLREDDDAVIESAFEGVERVSHHVTGESGKSERVQSVDDTGRNSNSGHAHARTTQERDRVTPDQMSEHEEREGRQQHPVRSAPANAKAPKAAEKFGFDDDRLNGVATRKKDQVQMDESWEPGVGEQGKWHEPKRRAATDEKEAKVAGKSACDEDQMTTGVTTGKKDQVQTDRNWEYRWREQDKPRHPVRREPADVKATKTARTTASDEQRMTEVRSKISSVFDFMDDDDDNGEPEVQAKDATWQPAKTASTLASLRRVTSVNGHRNVRNTPTDGARDRHQERGGVTKGKAVSFMDVDANERRAGKDRSADGNSATNQTSERSSSCCDTGARSQGRTSGERSQAIAAAGPENAATRVVNKNAECNNGNAQQNLDRLDRGNKAALRDMPTRAIRLRRTHRNLTEKEVEKLVEGFNSLGPGRWSSIKERWFAEDNDLLSSDLKDKWRSLVLAAKRPPEERRRKKFPAELPRLVSLRKLRRILPLKNWYDAEMAKILAKRQEEARLLEECEDEKRRLQEKLDREKFQTELSDTWNAKFESVCGTLRSNKGSSTSDVEIKMLKKQIEDLKISQRHAANNLGSSSSAPTTGNNALLARILQEHDAMKTRLEDAAGACKHVELLETEVRTLRQSREEAVEEAETWRKEALKSGNKRSRIATSPSSSLKMPPAATPAKDKSAANLRQLHNMEVDALKAMRLQELNWRREAEQENERLKEQQREMEREHARLKEELAKKGKEKRTPMSSFRERLDEADGVADGSGLRTTRKKKPALPVG
ncbi:hypothetical protein CBR_g54419 [Chara braunii]|uniref:Myb-like domain-containing protein n=1 Tax=Chara braunii TaxID=69332 RepID=A0A388MCD3_CHABU|nr:hypothetical protein CBR_g54419 [Chara braunii]|eukprot:GBG92119.1 hypothetical protein CBR_g54419 [Chara braunii]